MTASSLFRLRYADVAVTFTADQFQGVYRGKKYHDPDFDEVLKRAREYGCEKIMLTTMTLEGAYENYEVVRKHPETCFMTLGIHPYHVNDIYTQPNHLADLVKLGREVARDRPSALVAFGEIGLDYEYLNRADKETQIRAFRDQLEIAVEMQLPLFLHVRDSCDDFISVIKPFLPRLPRGGLVHSFAGTKREMRELVSLGLEISVNGISFRTEEQLDMVRDIPLDKLQLETDAPWCEIPTAGPVVQYLQDARPLGAARPYKKFVWGQAVKGRNESFTMERVAMVVAGIKGITIEEVADAAWNNSIRMFGLGVK